ncbi:MAG: hypothetical protein M0C28_25770 [Candidatus Moduliflexus flocculans]|nr:hypothetical protein [Candidatus Moduliflexus flocculans]
MQPGGRARRSWPGAPEPYLPPPGRPSAGAAPGRTAPVPARRTPAAGIPVRPGAQRLAGPDSGGLTWPVSPGLRAGRPGPPGKSAPWRAPRTPPEPGSPAPPGGPPPGRGGYPPASMLDGQPPARDPRLRGLPGGLGTALAPALARERSGSPRPPLGNGGACPVRARPVRELLPARRSLPGWGRGPCPAHARHRGGDSAPPAHGLLRPREPGGQPSPWQYPFRGPPAGPERTGAALGVRLQRGTHPDAPVGEGRPGLPDDLLLESLSIEETRQYGRNVLWASVVYGVLHYGLDAEDALAKMLGERAGAASPP